MHSVLFPTVFAISQKLNLLTERLSVQNLFFFILKNIFLQVGYNATGKQVPNGINTTLGIYSKKQELGK